MRCGESTQSSIYFFFTAETCHEATIHSLMFAFEIRIAIFYHETVVVVKSLSN